MHRFWAPLVAALLLFPAAARADVNMNPADYAGEALNIIPSGQYGGAAPVPAQASGQLQMYDALTPLAGNVTDADLQADFKSELLGTPGSPGPTTIEPTPRPGLTIVRDANDVPHIYGQTDDDVVWGAGWVLEEDRGALLDFGRYPGRLAAVDAPGIDAFSLVQKLLTFTPTPAVDALITKQQDSALKAAGKPGLALLHDINVYIQGINARLAFEHSTSKPFTRADVYSINALAGQLFGQGGGDEVRRAEFLSGLQQKFGDRKATTIFNDLSEHNDPDAPTTLSKPFPYEQNIPKVDSGNAPIANGSYTPITYSGQASRASRVKRYASNFLIVSGKRSATGHPLMVAGPQIGYYYPGLTLEMDLHGPTIDARGAAIPGGPGDILIGRGADFAWSLTSAGSDTNDQFAETLCGGSKLKYMYKGKCLKMGTISAGTITLSPTKHEVVTFHTTVHGPVSGYAKSDGKTVAISFKRSSAGKDVLWQLMFKDLSDGQVHSPQTFLKAAQLSPFTFNIPYIDNQHIAYYSAGLLPIRNKHVDPRLPTKGTGQYEWTGFLSAKDHPQAIDPASGELVNWNNRPAPDFGPADDEWNYGMAHRVTMLEAGLNAKPVQTLAGVVGAMNSAATQDLNAEDILPLVDQVLKGSTPPQPRDATMLSLLDAWRAAGAHRIDADLDGFYDQGGAPLIMDTLMPLLTNAVLDQPLGKTLDAQLSAFDGVAASTGSGYENGRLWIVDKDLSDLLGKPLKQRYRLRYCGDGDMTACQKALWGAFDAAGNAIADKQGPDPTQWKSDATAQRITLAPGVLTTTIRYTNRPSGIQQAITFTGHRP